MISSVTLVPDTAIKWVSPAAFMCCDNWADNAELSPSARPGTKPLAAGELNFKDSCNPNRKLAASH